MNDKRASDGGRIAGPRKSHERGVEAFYSVGATRFGDCHGGYLNSGLWKDGCEYLRVRNTGLVRSAERQGRRHRVMSPFELQSGTRA